MRYFPMFYDSKGKSVLVVGGGAVALQKLTALSSFEFDISVLAESFDDEICEILAQKGYKAIEKRYEESDAIGFDIVIAAVDDVGLQAQIHSKKPQTQLVNAVDLPQFCDFIFASMFEKEGMLVAVSSQSKAPSVAKELKERLKAAIPDGTAKLVEEIERIRASEPKGKERMAKISALTKERFGGY